MLKVSWVNLRVMGNAQKQGDIQLFDRKSQGKLLLLMHRQHENKNEKE